MIATDLSEYFGRDRVFQLPVTDGQAADFYTRVPVLFDDSATHDKLLARIEAGDEVGVGEAAGANGGTDIRARLRADGIPMFVHSPWKDLHVLAAADRPPLKPGQEHRAGQAQLTPPLMRSRSSRGPAGQPLRSSPNSDDDQ